MRSNFEPMRKKPKGKHSETYNQAKDRELKKKLRRASKLQKQQGF